MRKFFLSLPTLFAFIMVLSGCGKTAPEPSIEEKLTRVWTAKIVTEGNAVVYDKSKTTQIAQGYNGYRLDLSSKSAAKLTEKDGNTFSATWALSSDNKTITLTFNPAGSGPTGSPNTKSYTIVGDVTTNAITIQANEISAKTGGSLNKYDLINP